MKIQSFIFILLLTIILFSCGNGGSGSNNIYVNMLNSSGPWDGTQNHPYKTIQEGINAAKSGESVLVMDNAYFENVTLKAGVNLEPWKGTPKLAGKINAPAILAEGDNKIIGFMIRGGGSSAIQVDISKLIVRKDRIKVLIQDCEIHEANRGIEVITPRNLKYDANKRKSTYVDIIHNYIHDLNGDGINFKLIGPETGELQISVRIEDNVIYKSFTGVTLHAIGQGPNPRGFVRALYAGIICNNLIFKGRNGIQLYGENLGSSSITIFNNTIADNITHGINASTKKGPEGYGSAHPNVVNNIIIGNNRYGYQEFSEHCSASGLHNNLFFNNSMGHYADNETNTVIKNQKDLNKAIVNNKVIFYSGGNNIVANPLFVDGQFWWKGSSTIKGPHAFFLQQDETPKSPAVDKGRGTAKDAKLDKYSTHKNYIFDTGTVDIGFHYIKK